MKSKKNSVKNKYDPEKANHKSYVKRYYASFRGSKIIGNSKLKNL